MLGRESFGALGIIQNTVVSVSNVAAFGLGITATRYIAALRETAPDRLRSILGLCSVTSFTTASVASGLLLVLSGSIADRLLGAPDLAFALRISTPWVFFVTLNSYQIGVLAGMEAFASIARLNALQALVLVVLATGLTSQLGITGACVGLTLAAALQWLIYARALRRRLAASGIRPSFDHIGRESGVLVRFSLPAAISGVLGAGAMYACNAYMVRLPHGFADMAIVSAANNFRAIILFAPAFVNRAVSPILTSISRDSVRYPKLFWANVLLSTGIAVTICAALNVFTPSLLRLYGRDFSAGWLPVMLFSWSAVLEVVGGALYQRIFVQGRMWWHLLINLCWALILAFLGVALMQQAGARGLGMAYIVSWLFSVGAYSVAAGLLSRDRASQ